MKINDEVKYMKDHAHCVIGNLDKNSKTCKKFTCSIDTALLITNGHDNQKKIDDLMINILHRLFEKVIEVVEKNGKYKKKSGEVRQKYRKRKIKFDKLFMVYHNVHIDGSISVKPHFHFLFPKNYRLGIRYKYLMQALEDIAYSYNVQFHFSAKKRVTNLSSKEEKVIEKMAMTLQRNTDEDVRLYLIDDKFDRALSLLDKHFMSTNNVSYFMKQISIVHNRFKNMDISTNCNGVDLKDEIYFYLTKSQHNKIMLLKNNQVIDLDLSEILDREILTYAHGFKSNIMDILTDVFQIDDVSKEKLKYKIPTIELRSKQKVSTRNVFRETIREDIVNALSIAPSIVKFKHIIKKAGYNDIDVLKKKVNQHKKKETAFKVKTKNHMILEIGFIEMNLNWRNIQRIFMQNRRRKKKTEIESQIKQYEKKKEEDKEELLEFKYKPKEFLAIIYKKLPFGFKPLLAGFDIQHSEVANITTYLSDELIIVDYPDRVEIKKCDDVGKGVDAIIRFLPDNVRFEELDVVLKGSDKYITAAKKKLENATPVIKRSKQPEVKRKRRL